MTKKHMKVILISCLSILLVTGCGKIPKLSNGDEVVVKIKDKEFSANEYYEKLKESDNTSSILVGLVDEFITSKEKDETMEKDALDYAESQISYLKTQYESYGESFTDALKSAGYENEKALVSSIKDDYMKQLVAKKYIKESVKESEIKEYYENEIFGNLTVKHILIKPETTDGMTDDEISAAEDKAYQEAASLIEKINKDGKDSFDKYAKENSDDAGTASNGGLFEDFSKDSVVENFWKASYALKDGEMTSTPVKTEYGYHIILRVSGKEKPALDDVKDDVISSIVDKKVSDDQSLIAKTWVDIRKKYEMDIIDSKLSSSYDDSIKQYK